MKEQEENWTLVIKSSSGLFDLQLKEVWRYRDLLQLFVRRDFVAVYKQTILGPLWFFIQPLFTTITFTIVFGKIAGMSTGGVPPMLFYMAGITCWNFFSSCLSSTSTTFTGNAGIFGKVYFPRLIAPLSLIASNVLKLGVQFLLFLILLLYFYFTESSVQPNMYVLLFPLLIILMGGLGLGFGILISAITTKYRDIQFLIGFGVQLAMYATPVIYSVTTLPDKYAEYKTLLLANPMSSIIETFRYGFLGSGVFEWSYLIYSTLFTALILFIGMLVFNRVEKSFMDTV